MDIIDNTEEVTQKIKQLPGKDKPKALALRFYLEKKKKADDDQENEMSDLQNKYDLLSKPIFDEAQELIIGSRVPNQEELAYAQKFLTPEELETLKTHKFETKEIENFWVKVLENGELEDFEVTDKDKDALQYLQRIEIIHSENKHDFSLKFTFKENGYFTNQALQKSFVHNPKGQLIKTESTPIAWCPGKALTKKIVKKKQKNKKSGASRVISKEVDADSFFLFFRTIDISNIEKMDEDQINELHEKLDMDENLGSIIIDELIPYSIEYYLGIAESGEEGKEPKAEQPQLKGDEKDEDFSDEEDNSKQQKKKKK